MVLQRLRLRLERRMEALQENKSNVEASLPDPRVFNIVGAHGQCIQNSQLSESIGSRYWRKPTHGAEI